MTGVIVSDNDDAYLVAAILRREVGNINIYNHLVHCAKLDVLHRVKCRHVVIAVIRKTFEPISYCGLEKSMLKPYREYGVNLFFVIYTFHNVRDSQDLCGY